MKEEMTWETIVDILIDEFEEQKYKKDEKMPSENKMAVRFGVARAEIRRAYERLKAMGYIYSLQGYGSFFSGKKEKIHLIMNDSESFTDKMKAFGARYETRNIGIERVSDNPLVAQMLRLPEKKEEEIYCLSRLRLIDGEPVAIHTSFLPLKAFPHLPEEGREITSLYDYMKHCGYQNFKNENCQLVVTTLDKKERNLLNIKGYASSLVVTCRCVEQQTGEVLEVARTVYRSDKFVFDIQTEFCI